jgi:hypothetical protein
MTQKAINPPLSNVQVELLKLYTTGVSDETLLELKKTIAKFFLDRLRKTANEVWEEKGYSDTQMQAID